ncbi:hexosaminidase [Parapedobacter composti]|uniref:beta-N-acetylhexosaminidase n=1 Tax=Parapedobacter composti TaxID=623281 RepID=A0A1I1J618_9SPHI|nr:beta-N-acetylhexosaminidase [Parapedobacter composti]SFC44017.1 hexosaminidase [Parapedobacter composti]
MNRIKYALLAIIGLQIWPAQAEDCPIIPRPRQAEKGAATFVLDRETLIQPENGADTQGAIYYFQQAVMDRAGLELATSPAEGMGERIIRFRLVAPEALGDDSYRIAMDGRGILLEAPDEQGLFYAGVSLLQLIERAERDGDTLLLPCWAIRDAPRFGWRGVMLDESRHFFGKRQVKALLDWMAYYKLNVFHWHLTDVDGWRIEIKRYPRLTLVGGIGNHTNPLAPAQYYTQDEIREIIRYATERHIQVIPEIDMPGHATAANRAYPRYSGGGSERFPDFTFNPGLEETYRYLTDILREVNVLFPSRKIHIGGDEVHFGNAHWRVDTAVQALAAAHGLENLRAVEHYFIRRMADSVARLGNDLLGWDEIVDAGLPPQQTVVFWWRHDKPEQYQKAIAAGYRVVICPRIPYYFDFVQDSTHRIGRKWQGRYVPIEQVYGYPAEALFQQPGAERQVLGVQANLWTEQLSSPQQLEYMVFPRIAALAESAWTSEGRKDYADFSLRLRRHLPRYAKAGLYYFNPFQPQQYPEYQNGIQRIKMMPDTEAQTRLETSGQ